MELRRKSLGYGHRGWTWLHASKTVNSPAANHFGITDGFTGGFVGAFFVIEILDVDDEQSWRRWRPLHLSPEYEPGCNGWVISAVMRLSLPVPAKGNVGLFPPPVDALQVLLRTELVESATPLSGV